jgi:hypothetical protein
VGVHLSHDHDGAGCELDDTANARCRRLAS